MKSKILLLVALATFPVILFAQDASSSVTELTGLSVQQQLYLTWLTVAFKYVAELYSSVRMGGGLKRILWSFWLGENLPKVVAEDYKKELTTPPFNPPTT